MQNLVLSDRLRGASALFGAALIYSSFGILIRILAETFGDYSQVAARMALAFVFILLLNFLLRRGKALSATQRAKALLLGIIFAGILMFFTLAINETKIANVVFLLYAGNLVTSLILGTLIFKESLGAQKFIALALAFVGLLMFSNVFLALTFGTIAALLSGVLEGGADTLRKSLKGVDRPTVLQYQFFAAAALSTLVMFAMPEPIIKEISLWPILALIVFALLQIKLGDWLLYGFQHFDVNVGTVILASELFFAALLGFVIFGETLSMQEILGGITIFGASVLSAWEFKKK